MVMATNKLTYTKLNVAVILTIVTARFIAIQVLFLMQQNGVENEYFTAAYRLYFNSIFQLFL